MNDHVTRGRQMAGNTPRGKRTMVYENRGRTAEESLYDAKGNLDTKTIKPTIKDPGHKCKAQRVRR